MFERDQRKYMGYIIGLSLFSNRWVVRQGWRYVASAPSAFDAVELVDGIIDAVVKEQVLQGNLRAVAAFSERPGRDEAINGKNLSIETIAETIARAQSALERDMPGFAGQRAQGRS